MNRIQKLIFRSILLKLIDSNRPLSMHELQSTLYLDQDYDFHLAIKALVNSGIVELVNDHTVLLISKHPKADIA